MLQHYVIYVDAHDKLSRRWNTKELFFKHFGCEVSCTDIVVGAEGVSGNILSRTPENLPVKRCTQFKVATSVRPGRIKGQTQKQVYRQEVEFSAAFFPPILAINFQVVRRRPGTQERCYRRCSRTRRVVTFRIRSQPSAHTNVDLPRPIPRVTTSDCGREVYIRDSGVESYRWSRCCINISLGATTKIKPKCPSSSALTERASGIVTRLVGATRSLFILVETKRRNINWITISYFMQVIIDYCHA